MSEKQPDKQIAIRVDHVSKNFVLPHERVTSVKSAFVKLFKKKDKSKEVQHALRDINFEVQEGEFFGIVGRNGSGKSTLLKILANIYLPTKGKIYTRGKLVPFIELGVGFNPELTGRENVYLNGALLGFNTKEIDAIYDEIVSFAELEDFMDQKLKNYSSGMQVRLAFSMATRSEADILLIDEVLAVGDAEFQRKCFNYFHELKRKKKTVIFVSHDMNAVREYCDRAILIESSRAQQMGTADAIAQLYTRLFIESTNKDDDAAKNPDLRWGTKEVSYTSIAVTPRVLSDEEYLQIKLVATAAKDIEGAVFGVRVRNAAGLGLLGTNSKLLKRPVPPLKAGETIKLEWRVPNVFKDGKYSVDPAITLQDGEICDWWDDAATFTTKKNDHIPYVIAPDIEMTITIANQS
ncbi:MAG: ABC transporter ATP-binding protein [Candidatus Doudnabacteria bacterium]|nr:ABC transporter ATP-binding protein [Candidatus Doudnabacteria bacterium]